MRATWRRAGAHRLRAGEGQAPTCGRRPQRAGAHRGQAPTCGKGQAPTCGEGRRPLASEAEKAETVGLGWGESRRPASSTASPPPVRRTQSEPRWPCSNPHSLLRQPRRHEPLLELLRYHVTVKVMLNNRERGAGRWILDRQKGHYSSEINWVRCEGSMWKSIAAVAKDLFEPTDLRVGRKLG